MRSAVESQQVSIGEVICRMENWSPSLKANGKDAFLTLNARAVEFIAKPGKIRELHACLGARVLEVLNECEEFSSAIVLTSHKEPRLAVVLTFWTSEPAARSNHWEDAPAIRKLVSPFIDVCCKVQTYEAALPSASHTTSSARTQSC